jgi:hypothetical protein
MLDRTGLRFLGRFCYQRANERVSLPGDAYGLLAVSTYVGNSSQAFVGMTKTTIEGMLSGPLSVKAGFV